MKLWLWFMLALVGGGMLVCGGMWLFSSANATANYGEVAWFSIPTSVALMFVGSMLIGMAAHSLMERARN